ncbi:MAG: DUF167 domain-containing protein [Candidatus Dojkabacteria bacterium]|nr:DUF167 domain-containing protein [Candidatus Dojkabacteria bacterium]MDQ7020676.1 DUF167 domain-containing protein [Candidatus Dojkabacteria bacterium]
MIIKVKVNSNSKVEKIIKLSNNYYKASFSETREKGKANKKLVKLLSDYFNISITKIVIKSGFTNSEKIIELLS